MLESLKPLLVGKNPGKKNPLTMDKFLVQAGHGGSTRGNASAISRLRQTRIEHGKKVEVVEDIQLLVQLMETCELKEMAQMVKSIEERFISLELLEQTKIGHALVQMRYRAENEEVKASILQLERKWKETALAAWKRRQKRVEIFGRNMAH